jgi:epidermal growth factor receptor substrate 15
MIQQLLSDFIKQVLTLSCLVASPLSFALGETLLQQSVQTLDQGIYLVIGVILILLFAFILLKLKLNKLRRQTLVQQDDLNVKTSLLDNFNIGMLHINDVGEVIYANRVAAYFLGGREDQLIGKPLVACFETEHSEVIASSLQSKEFCNTQIYTSLRNRHLLLGFKPQKNILAGIANIVSLDNVSDFQQNLDNKSAQISHQSSLMDNTQLGQMSVDLANNSFTANPIFYRLLGLDPAKLAGELKPLLAFIDKSDQGKWDQSVEELKNADGVDFSCTFNRGEDSVFVRLYGLIVERNDLKAPLRVDFTLQDLTELARAQKQNMLNKQKLKALLSANIHPMYLFDDRGQLQDCNPAFELMFATKLGQIKDQLVNQLAFFCEQIRQMHPSSQVSSSSMYTTSGAGREFEQTLKGDKTHILRIKLQAFTYENGKYAGMVGMIEDITVFKQTQKQLEHEQKRFADMLNMAPLSIAMIDADDQIVQVNHGMMNRLGLSEQELKKTSFYQLFDDPNNSGKAAKQLHQTGRLRKFQAHLKGKNNQLHPSELHIDLFDKEQHQYLCWISDISGEQFHQDKFDSLLQNSSMPMAVVGEKGFTRVNPAMCEFFSVEDDRDMLGLFPYSANLNNNEQDVEILKAKIAQVKLDGQAQTVLWEHRSGEALLPCQATYVPMYKGPVFDSILCIWIDLREVKKADQARMEAINQRQLAEREMQEKQKMLKSSQDQLASKAKTLADTESELQAAKVDLSEKQSEFSDLQQAHQSVTEHLQNIQQEYSQSRELLAQSQSANTELEAQLEESSGHVSGLQKQRNQIADALQYSERQYKGAQQKLQESESNSARLKQEQVAQQEKIEGFVEQISSLKHSIEDKDQKIQEVSGQINTLQSKLASSSQNSEKLRQLLINQRKASDEAAQQRRELEGSCQIAQSELSNKARQIDHLQHEMQKFEEMSNQQKGDMQQQQKLLEQELTAKQGQLQDTQQALDEIKQQAAQEKAEKLQQQKDLQKLQQELAEVERLTSEQQQTITEAEQQMLDQQRQLQEELLAKQQKLQETEQILNEAKQQTEAEKAAKAEQQKIFEKLQSELREVEQRAVEQQQSLAQSDEKWRQQQLELNRQLEAKQQQLHDSQQKLDENLRQAEAEKRLLLEQQQKFEQVKVELADVENRSQKQRQMMAGSDEQWRQHHEEIEQQKQQLQQALLQAQKQNEDMQSELQGSLQELQQAESQVSETQAGEQKLQKELEDAKRQAEELKQRLLAQEKQELQLRHQVDQQQKTLQAGEQNIQSLQDSQQQLSQELQAVQHEYSSTKQNLDEKQGNHSQLSQQLSALEENLKHSKQQLDDKETALQDAQNKLAFSQQKLVEQEKALVAAHQEELKLAKQDSAQTSAPKDTPEFAKLAMPANPTVWFDLLPYLQKNPGSGALAESLNTLIDELYQVVEATDKAVASDDNKQILPNTQKLALLAGKINSEPLIDLANRLQGYSREGEVDNISIFWPNVKKSMMTTLRVIYSQLHS